MNFRLGMRHGAPFLLVLVPFGLLFGVVATEAGLDVLQVMGFTVLVIAGAAQFTAVQMLNDHAPTVVIIATSLAVNMRMAMYSAALMPHVGKAPLWKRALMAYALTDQTFAATIGKYELDPSMTLADKLAFYLGVGLLIALPWYAATLAGAMVGSAIPPGYGLDLALPVTFLAMIGPMLKTGAHVAAAFTSVLLSLVFGFLPYNLGLIIAALAAMAVGAEIERRRVPA